MLIPTVATVKQNHTETIAYLSDNKCDEILIRSENEVCLINSSQYSKSLVYTSLDLLEDANVTYLDKYYLTHYSWSLDEDIETLIYNLMVDKIYIPSPRNSDEETILKILYKSVENSRTEIVTFRDYETVRVGEYNVNLLYSVPYGETSMNAVVIASDNEIYTYLSSGLLTDKTEKLFRSYISLSNTVILGEHGKKYKEKVYLTEYYDNIKNIIIQGSNVFLKQANMQQYLDNGCNIISQPENIVYLKNQ
jgi:beta-lactamase superfamily II metal-dependent hydrolase